MTEENLAAIVCENITHIRQTHNLSKTEMAQRLHICIASLNKIERGELPPRTTLDLFDRIEEEFGLHLLQFIKPLHITKP